MERKQTLTNKLMLMEKHFRALSESDMQKELVRYLRLKLQKTLEQLVYCTDEADIYRVQGSARSQNELLQVLTDTRAGLEETINE